MGALDVLPLIGSVTDNFEEKSIQYCHWKSNEHLSAACMGDTDLDILFSWEQYDLVEKILLDLGFKKCISASFLSYPYIYDFVGIDSFSGKLVHIHAHFKLILGESRVKSYHLAWEDVYLDRSALLTGDEIPTPKFEDELILLIVRYCLKTRWKYSDTHVRKQSYIDHIREFSWLSARVSPKELNESVCLYLDESCVASFLKMLELGVNRDTYKDVCSSIKNYIEPYRRYSYSRGLIVRYYRKIMGKFSAVNKRITVVNMINHRVFPRRGVVISILGADGSGKSTQVSRIVNIFKKKLDTKYVYMGSGDGKTSWYLWGSNYLIKLIKSARVKGSPERQKKSKLEDKPSYSLIRYLYAWLVSIDKKSKLKLVKKFKEKGGVVVTDRYPQSQFYGFNDGPLIPEQIVGKTGFVKRIISKNIVANYESFSKFPPDIVIKLVGSPETFYNRRDGSMSIDKIILKQDGILKLDFSAPSSTFEVSADQSLEEVTKEIMSKISQVI